MRNPLLPSAAYDELQSLLVAIRLNIKTGGIVIKARAPGETRGGPSTTVSATGFLVDFDHNNDGCITKHEFLRNIYRTRLSATSRPSLVKAYDAGHGVNSACRRTSRTER